MPDLWTLTIGLVAEDAALECELRCAVDAATFWSPLANWHSRTAGMGFGVWCEPEAAWYEVAGFVLRLRPSHGSAAPG